MNQKEWDKWKEQPQTVEFFKYLSDFREQIGRDVAIEISSGNYMTEEVIRFNATHCGIYSDIEHMDYSDIENFYEDEAISLIKKEEIEDVIKD